MLKRQAGKYRLEDNCRRCRGSGWLPTKNEYQTRRCRRCKGKGYVVKMVRAG